MDSLDNIKDIDTINLGLMCIKSNYYNNKYDLEGDCYHTCIVKYKNGYTKYIRLNGIYIYKHLFHLLSKEDKKHLQHLATPETIDTIINDINDDDIIKLNRSYLYENKKSWCHYFWLYCK